MATRSSRGNPAFSITVIGIILIVVFLGLVLWIFDTPKSIDYDQMIDLATRNKIAKVAFVGNDRLTGEIRETELASEEVREIGLKRKTFQTELVPAYNERLMQLLIEKKVKIERREDPMAWLTPTLPILVVVAIILAIFLFFVLPRMRDPMGGFVANYLKAPARRYERGKSRVTFDDVADMESAKSELREVIDFLREPKKFERLGAQVPKGVLLAGPPGTGKTLLARATAGEAEVPFFSINAAEFMQLYVGVGASRVRDLFKTAKETAPCVLFIDEIDAVGRMRGAGLGGGADEREQTLNQILGEMDGFQPNDMVIVLAATNRPDVLDPALLRPGRFDRHITVDRQNWQGRLAVLRVHTRNKPLAEDVDLEAVARQMTGMTGADLRNLCNEAALLATREGKMRVERTDFDRAADRVLIGPKREEVLTEDDKRRTAYHESGHTLVAWLVPGANKPQKVSIVPRGRTLGVTFMMTDAERYHYGLDYFKTQLVTMMGGRAADRLVYGQSFAGHENDLREATRMARYMVTHWGMSDRIGPMSLRIGEEHVFLGKEIQQARDFSEGVAHLVDEETRKLLSEADDRAFDLLKDNRATLDLLVAELLKREELSKDEIEVIMNLAKK